MLKVVRSNAITYDPLRMRTTPLITSTAMSVCTYLKSSEWLDGF
jgi:hypothetical protein